MYIYTFKLVDDINDNDQRLELLLDNENDSIDYTNFQSYSI